jgi:hypothetical protein
VWHDDGVTERYTELEAREDAAALVELAGRSIAELRAHARAPARVRMHPLDGEMIVAAQYPEYTRQRLLRLHGLPVELDEGCRIGWPVAEFDP